MIVGANTVYFSTFPGMETVDLDTWEPRKPTREEFYDGVKVLDALDNIHFMSNYNPWFGFEGLPPVMCIPEGFAARARNSSKVLKMGYSKDSELFTIKMAKVVGADAMVSCMASPPLTFYTDAIESLYRGIEANFPVTILSGGIMGGTVPATVAGATLDFVNTGPVSSKTSDFQCGYEKAILATVAALSGAHIILLCGSLFGELVFHPVQAILDNDLSGMIGRFLRGVDVSDETLAMDLIDKVGPIPGFYLDKEHTRKWWKKEHFLPEVSDRMSLPEWIESGKKSALDYAKERMLEIVRTHEPEPLAPNQEEEVEKILEEARQYYRKKGMMS
jgi:trimethylamine:corrinoid methyltransferase-like protein